MTIKASTLRPGLLVSLKTSTTGNVRYMKRDLDAKDAIAEVADVAKDGSVARWETTRIIQDAAENELAGKVRSQIRVIVGRICNQSSFGLLCPESRQDELKEAIAEARKLAEEFNANANCTRLNVYIIAGRVASDDVEAMRAINSEVRELLRDMEKGITNLEVKQIRDAASRAKELAGMLTADAQTRLQMSIDAARAAARDITKANAEGTAVKVDKRAAEIVSESQAMFLDLDDAGEVAAPKQETRAIDIDDETPAPAKRSSKRAAARQLDL